MTRLGWYLNRLRAMSPAEVGYRVRQRVRTELERVRLAVRPELLPDNALWLGLGQRGTPDWQAWAAEDGPWRCPTQFRGVGTRQQFVARYPEVADQVVTHADAILQGRVRLFDHVDVVLGAVPDWHRDPVTGRHWPADRFYADIGSRWGGAKTIWEAARHQHLITLAQAHWLRGDRRYVAALERQLTAWLQQNQPLRGVHWTSGLELGIRLLSWWWVRALVAPAALPAMLCRDWTREIVLYGGHLARHLSAYSSANNHLIGEASGLLAAALLVPGWTAARDWRRLALRTLTREADRQILPDGAPAEQAIHYHGFVIDFFLWWYRVAETDGCAMPGPVVARLAQAGEFLQGMMDAGGGLPDIGDSDGGYAFVVTPDLVALAQSRLATLAVVCGRGEFAQAAGSFDARSWWLLGESGALRFGALPRTPTPRVSAFPYGGYWVLHSRGADDAADARLTFDCGPLGYLSLAAHGHADCLGVWLSVGGQPLLVDSGTYTYHEEPAWRRYFRGTAAHNTIRIDGVDQSEATGATMWGRRARPRFLRHLSTPALQWVEGQHDGYTRLAAPVVHRRAVACAAPDYFLVLDWLLGRGRHAVEQFFHFPAGSTVQLDRDDCRLTLNGRVATIRFAGDPRAAARVVSGATAPIEGWVSPHFGARVPSPVLVREWTGECPVALATVVWLGAGEPPRWESWDAAVPDRLRAALCTATWRDEFRIDVPAVGRDGRSVRQLGRGRGEYMRTVGGDVIRHERLD